MIRFGHPDVAYTRRLIHPSKAEELGAKILQLPRVANAEDPFNVTIALQAIGEDQPPHMALTQALNDAEGLDPDTYDMLALTGDRAISKMSGLKRGGLPGYYYPYVISLDVNVYEPGAEFPAHYDKGLGNDVAAVTLLGRGATFWHVKDPMFDVKNPDPSQVIHSWQRTPGDAVIIRNHPTARNELHSFPRHAVLNGDERRVSLQVQLSYNDRHR